MPSRVDIVNLAFLLPRHHFLVTRLLGMQKAKNHESSRLPIRSQMIARQSSTALIRLPIARSYVGRAYWWAQSRMLASAPEYTVLKLLSENHCSGSLGTTSTWEGTKSLSLFFLKLTDGFHIPTLTPGFHLELDFAVGQCCFVFSVLTCSVILKSTMNAQYYAEKSVQIVNWGFHHKTPPTLGRNVWAPPRATQIPRWR